MPMYLAIILPTYLAIGSIAYVLDLRWGVPVRRFFVNLVSATPQEMHEGFLVGRKRSTMLVWAMLISLVLSLGLVTLGLESWYVQAVLSIAEGLFCFVGMLGGPLALKAFRAIGIGLAKVDQIEKTVQTDGKKLLDEALHGAKEAAARVVDAITPAGPGRSPGLDERPPAPTSEEERQGKIDKMDELLGKKKRERSDG